MVFCIDIPCVFCGTSVLNVPNAAVPNIAAAAVAPPAVAVAPPTAAAATAPAGGNARVNAATPRPTPMTPMDPFKSLRDSLSLVVFPNAEDRVWA